MFHIGIFTQCATESKVYHRTPSVVPIAHSGLAVRKRHDSPFPAPGPLARLRAAASRQCTELLVLASRETNNRISLAGTEG